MSDLVGNPEDRFSHNEAHIVFQASYYDDGSREGLFLERRNRIAGTCETHGNFTDARYEYHTEVPTVIVGENKSFVYCAVAKASSCLWKSVLSIIEFGKDYSSLYQWYKRLPRLPEYRSAHTPQETQEFLETATSFMFVREPYGRLFSAYIDKLFHPNIVFWRGSTSRRILRSLRTNVTWGHNSDFAYDVTFAEMIQFLVLRSKSDRILNEHFAPMYSGCNPCGYNKIYVGKLETFAADSKFIISKLDRNFDYKGLLQRITTKSAAHDAVARVRSLFQVLNATQSAPYPPISINCFIQILCSGEVARVGEF